MIQLKHGRIEDPEYRQWLTEGVDRVFVNNFADVFGSRSGCKSKTQTIDSKIAALFATMKPGSVMVTMHPIDALGHPRDKVMQHRHKHNLRTPCRGHASFFSLEEIKLGPANETVSWSANGKCKKTILVYKYTRLRQSDDGEGAVFLCTNHESCERSRNATPIPATALGEDGLVMNFCNCKYEAIRTRGKKKCKPSQKVLEGLQ